MNCNGRNFDVGGNFWSVVEHRSETMSTAALQTHVSVLGASLLVSKRLGQQLGHADKIIRCSHPPSSQLGSVSPSKARFPKTSHGLHPTKDLFDPLSNPLTEGIAFMTRGSIFLRNRHSSSYFSLRSVLLRTFYKPGRFLLIVSAVS